MMLPETTLAKAETPETKTRNNDAARTSPKLLSQNYYFLDITDFPTLPITFPTSSLSQHSRHHFSILPLYDTTTPQQSLLNNPFLDATIFPTLPHFRQPFIQPFSTTTTTPTIPFSTLS